MRLAKALAHLIRRPARRGPYAANPWRAVWVPAQGPGVLRGRSCSVCGGDPRHLCRRCREA